MKREFCTVKTIDDLIKMLESYKNKIGGDAAVIMSRDEEGNEYGDILMFETDTVENMVEDSCYRGYEPKPAVSKDNNNDAVLVIFPNL